MSYSSGSSDQRRELEQAVPNKQGETFFDLFISMHDTLRAEMHRWYSPTSRLLWNGNPVSNFRDFFENTLPPTRHTVEALEVQEVQTGQPFGARPLILNATGKITEGRNPPETFHRVMVIEALPNKQYYVVSDIVRSF